MSSKSLIERLKRQPSLMSAEEYKGLATYAKQVRDRVGSGALACEVGSWHGVSTIIIAEQMKTWSIDLGGDLIHGADDASQIGKASREILLSNLANQYLIPDQVIPICSTSNCLFPIPSPIFDFALIDADHSYEWCGRDMLNVARVLKPRGIMAVHDYIPGRETDSDFGVTDAVDDFLENNPWEKIELVGSLVFIKRTA